MQDMYQHVHTPSAHHACKRTHTHTQLPAHTHTHTRTRLHVQDVELTDDAVDAALRAVEELVVDPACLPAVTSQPGLLDVLLKLLHVDSSSQVGGGQGSAA